MCLMATAESTKVLLRSSSVTVVEDAIAKGGNVNASKELGLVGLEKVNWCWRGFVGG